MSDTIDRANDLVADYESQLMPDSQESAKLEAFFGEIDRLEAMLDRGEISSDELAKSVAELRERAKIGAMKALGGPATSSVESSSDFKTPLEAEPTLVAPKDVEDDEEDAVKARKDTASKKDNNMIPVSKHGSFLTGGDTPL